MPVPDDPAWRHYTDTILGCTLPDGARLELDLRAPLDARALARLATLGFGHGAAVITPCNPAGRVLADGENAERVARFAEALGARREAHLPCLGRSPDGRHVEHGFLIAVARGEALRLAAAWGQSGLYWLAEGQMWLVPVHSPEDAVPLPAGGARA